MAGKTTAKGLGYAHQQARAALPPPAGEPCPFCGAPMWPQQALDADHEIPRAFGGGRGPLRWAHRVCNRRAGAALGGRLRRRLPAQDRRVPWKDRWS